MLRLYLVRHAKSSWGDLSLSDFDRPLNARGLADAPDMGKRLAHQGILPDLLLSSPAIRAITTCRKMAAAVGYSEDKIRMLKKLYHADPDQLLGVLRESEPAKSVMVFGHNPGLTEFANRLLGTDIDNIPTCGVVAAELNPREWQEISWSCGRLLFFDFPKNPPS